MERQINSIFASLITGPILIPVTYILNLLTAMTSLDVPGWKGYRALELMRKMMFVTLYFLVAVTHCIWSYLPKYELMASKWISSMNEEQNVLQQTTMSRVLSQLLELVNDTPASSEKYEFARILTARIIQENMAHGDAALIEANRLALSAGFWRTLKLLICVLEEVHHQQVIKGSGWSSILVQSGIFRKVAAVPHVFSLDNLLQSVGDFFFTSAKHSLNTRPLATAEVASGLMGEKLAMELLWITELMKACSSISEAIEKWGAESSLIGLSLSSHPRVQASLLRISVLFFKELAFQPKSFNSSVKTSILISWLPLLCHSKSGFDAPTFSSTDKNEILGLIEQIIFSLTEAEQESVFTCWLKEYVSSSSEWPNLQKSFESWRHTTRKAMQNSAF